MQNGRILFRLTDDALLVANTGRPFSLRGLEAVVYGWTTSKAEDSDLDLPKDRPFQSESDARAAVKRLYDEKRRVLEISNQRASEISQQKQTAQSYAGRVLLELLQNAVDANRTTPIGYKGIGFRSILTLTDSPEIHSAFLHVHWSPEIARNALNSPALPPTIVLAFPQWCDRPPSDITGYDTIIKLPLSPERRSQIEREWKAATANPSLLVFINGVTEVRWETSQSSRVWTREPSGEVVIVSEVVDDQPAEQWLWHIHHSGQAAVAVAELSDGSVVRPRSGWSDHVCSFFQTEDLNPFRHVLVHASFPLSPDRKHIDSEHEETPNRFDEIAEAMAKAVAHRSEADMLDILQHTDPEGSSATRIQKCLCDPVKSTLQTHRILKLRSCPRQDALPYAFRRNGSRLANWETYKKCLSEFRPEGLDGLAWLPEGIENDLREKTLLWLNPKAPLAADELRALPWAPIESSDSPVPSSSPPLFALPSGDFEVPAIPAGIRLHFLDRSFHDALVEHLGDGIASSLIHDVLGVYRFKLLDVIKEAVLPVVAQDAQPTSTVGFLRAMWDTAGDERDSTFTWKDPLRAQLVRSCKVTCRDGSEQLAVGVYAGREWTESEFLDRAYGSRGDCAFLHLPPTDQVEKESWTKFYRWLGIGWCPKVLPVIDEPEIGNDPRRGPRWMNDCFSLQVSQPSDWSRYCKEAWEEKYEASHQFTRRSPHLVEDWQFDGDSGVLQQPGAFETIAANWSSYVPYRQSRCFWSANRARDYADQPHTSDSYLFWQLQHFPWLPTGEQDCTCAPRDAFLPGEISQSRNLRSWVCSLKIDIPEEMATTLGIRRNWQELTEPDWERWLESAARQQPQTDLYARENIRRLYTCLLEHGLVKTGALPPFKHEEVWWIERGVDHETWKTEKTRNNGGYYLDRPDLESLRLPGLFVFPARLGGWETKAKALFEMRKLSDDLHGEPQYTNSAELLEVSERVRQRTSYLVAYLGLERGETGRTAIAAALKKIAVFEVESLHVTWTLAGQILEGAATSPSSFFHRTPAGWQLLLVREKRQHDPYWGWERLAETILLACGFRPTEKAANVCNILTLAFDRLPEKLTGLGVAPETITAARDEIVADPPPPTTPDTPVSIPAPSPTVFEGLQHPERVFDTGAGNARDDRLAREAATADNHYADISSTPPPQAKPLDVQRDHTEARSTQESLRGRLRILLEDTSWTVSNGEVVVGRGRIDIAVERAELPDQRLLIEVKQIKGNELYWREEQIQTAEEHRGRYVMALVRPMETDGHEVWWVWNPLVQFGALPRCASWTWKEKGTSSGFGPNWRPLESPPFETADHYKAVITISNEFLAQLPNGLDHLRTFLRETFGL